MSYLIKDSSYPSNLKYDHSPDGPLGKIVSQQIASEQTKLVGVYCDELRSVHYLKSDRSLKLHYRMTGKPVPIFGWVLSTEAPS